MLLKIVMTFHYFFARLLYLHMARRVKTIEPWEMKIFAQLNQQKIAHISTDFKDIIRCFDLKKLGDQVRWETVVLLWRFRLSPNSCRRLPNLVWYKIRSIGRPAKIELPYKESANIALELLHNARGRHLLSFALFLHMAESENRTHY